MTDVANSGADTIRSDTESSTGGFTTWKAAIRNRADEADSGHIDVYIRSMLPPAGAKSAQVAALQRIRELVEETPFEHISLNVWGERLCRCEVCQSTDVGRAMLDTVRKFDTWGDKFDASAGPYFEEFQVDSAMTGESHHGVIPPRVTVALYLDGTLSGVFPCQMAGESCSVVDCCGVLESIAELPPRADSGAEPESEAEPSVESAEAEPGTPSDRSAL